MHADSFFRMGATHAVCQDYATAGQAGGVTYALLSDGCSGSPSTDWGARFLVRAAELRAEGLSLGQLGGFSQVIRAAEAMAITCELPRRCLDATLLAALGHGRFVQVYQAGDGVVAARKRGGGFRYWATDCSKGAPFYLSYSLSPSGRAVFDGLNQTERLRWGTKGEEISEARAPEPIVSYGFLADDFDIVLMFSDGADSFITKTGQHVPLADVLEQAFDFKNYPGHFISRRCSRFLSSFCAERGWRHEDDFSCAGIYLGEAP